MNGCNGKELRQEREEEREIEGEGERMREGKEERNRLWMKYEHPMVTYIVKDEYVPRREREGMGRDGVRGKKRLEGQ